MEEWKYHYIHLANGEQKCRGTEGGINLTTKQTFAVLTVVSTNSTNCKCSSLVCGLFIVNSEKALLGHSSSFLYQTFKIGTSGLVVV